MRLWVVAQPARHSGYRCGGSRESPAGSLSGKRSGLWTLQRPDSLCSRWKCLRWRLDLAGGFNNSLVHKAAFDVCTETGANHLFLHCSSVCCSVITPVFMQVPACKLPRFRKLPSKFHCSFAGTGSPDLYPHVIEAEVWIGVEALGASADRPRFEAESLVFLPTRVSSPAHSNRNLGSFLRCLSFYPVPLNLIPTCSRE